MQASEAGELGLPPLFTLSGFDGSLSEYVERLHWQYKAIVGDPGLRPFGMPVQSQGGTCPDGRDAAFWHIITDNVPGGGRMNRRLSLSRAAMLGRVWHLLEWLAAGDLRAVWWREPWQRGWRLHVAPIDFGFLVVLDQHDGALYLVTAFPLSRGQRRRAFDHAAKSWHAGHCERPDTQHPAWRRRHKGRRLPARHLAVLGLRT